LKIPPPRTFPQVLVKLKETYQIWMALHRDFPKVERLGIGSKIEQSFLDCLELTFCLSYLSPEHKIPMLNKAITRFDVLKFFAQLAWEARLIPTDKYSDLVSRLSEIGRQMGGWKKGLQSKTPRPPLTGRGEKQ
jgi:hypothetical protein